MILKLFVACQLLNARRDVAATETLLHNFFVLQILMIVIFRVAFLILQLLEPILREE